MQFQQLPALTPLPLPLPLPLPTTTIFPSPLVFKPNPPSIKNIDGLYPYSSVKSYSGNYSGILEKTVNLYQIIPILISAVDNKYIRGVRYFDANTGKQIIKGSTTQNAKKLLKKKNNKTKRKRLDFDHQISIFSECHVKLFKTGKMLIPACGSPEKAKKAFEEVAQFCNIDLKKVQCNNENLHFYFPNVICVKELHSWLQENGFNPIFTKTGRLKIILWWNNNYYNACRCKCFPKHCSSIMKSYRGFAHMEGKCLSSTIMFGSKSATIFGTHFDEQKRNLVWTLRQMYEAFKNNEKVIIQ